MCGSPLALGPLRGRCERFGMRATVKHRAPPPSPHSRPAQRRLPHRAIPFQPPPDGPVSDPARHLQPWHWQPAQTLQLPPPPPVRTESTPSSPAAHRSLSDPASLPASRCTCLPPSAASQSASRGTGQRRGRSTHPNARDECDPRHLYGIACPLSSRLPAPWPLFPVCCARTAPVLDRDAQWSIELSLADSILPHRTRPPAMARPTNGLATRRPYV